MKFRGMRMSFDAVVNCVILITCGVMLATILGFNGRSAENGPDLPKVGDRAEALPGVRYEDSPATLVLNVRSTCSFCTASMPFYRTLSEAVRMPAGRTSRLVVVGGEGMDVLTSYLAQHSLQVDQVVSHQGTLLATPALFLVDRKGKIAKVWLGQQDTAREEQILKAARGEV